MYVVEGPTWLGGVIVLAGPNVTPRSIDFASRILTASPLKTDHIAYTWSRYGLTVDWFTSIHCLSTTSPKLKLDEFGSLSRYAPPLPTVHDLPRLSLYTAPIAPLGCMFAQKALNGSVV